MLELRNIVKEYVTGDTKVTALRGINLRFRKNEFVAVLGASGCGKTTLLNIVGGLDRYTDGDLLIGGVSTKLFRDADWDSYRNHSVGFVFQSYNLIPHQSVLANVELALTLSGVSKAERRARAREALEKVGLGDQLNKKPNQMSGGQMQRVAIARALVNNPDILLADEPTGALDTTTSVQIMDLLKEVAEDRLVIMVTHNPELAEEYANRIVRLRDGELMDDSNPLTEEEIAAWEAATAAKTAERTQAKSKKAKKGKKEGKTSMSFSTAFGLSLNNLLTKKGRTVLTSFAGSIGIIGIALILSLSNGIQAYINQVQEDTLSSFPMSVQRETSDTSAMMNAMLSVKNTEDHSDEELIYVDDSMGTMMSAMASTVTQNLDDFKVYLDAHYDEIKDAVSDIQYTYALDLQVYNEDASVKLGLADMLKNMGGEMAGMSEMVSTAGMSGMDVMSEMIDNDELLDQQYEVVAGHWPENENEVVLVVSSNNQISKMTLYMLGVLPHDDLPEIMQKLMKDGKYEPAPIEPYSFDDFLGMTFYMLNAADFYENENGVPYTVDGNSYKAYYDVREQVGYDGKTYVSENGVELKIAGIIRPREGVTGTSISGAIGYTKELTDLMLTRIADSAAVKQQQETPTVNVLTGRPFEKKVYTMENIDELLGTMDASTKQMFYTYMTGVMRERFAAEPPVVGSKSLIGFAGRMEPAQQAALIENMITLATAVSGEPAVSGLYMTLSTENMQIDSKEDLLFFLPLFTQEQTGAVIGGLAELCGDQVTQIYDSVNQAVLQMEMDDEMFYVLMTFMTAEEFGEMQASLQAMLGDKEVTQESVLKQLGYAKEPSPASINFYAKDFASKDKIEAFISDYNKTVEEKDQVTPTDVVGAMMDGVSLIVNIISYVLIAFVSISLVVSSIMIGIITYISVLERTKEIGILRSIGASKRDISRVFNAETLLVGLTAGLIGVLATVLLTLPVNAIIYALSGIAGVRAALPLGAAVILVLISMVLTLVAGLFPAKVASKKDPVVALRSE